MGTARATTTTAVSCACFNPSRTTLLARRKKRKNWPAEYSTSQSVNSVPGTRNRNRQAQIRAKRPRLKSSSYAAAGSYATKWLGTNVLARFVYCVAQGKVLG